RLGGLVGGLAGAVAIMIVIAIIAPGTGFEVWTSPSVIASIILRDNAEADALSVILGTVMHLSLGAVFGVVFSWVAPRLTATYPYWIVLGLIYGVFIWLAAILVLPAIVDADDISTETYFTALLIANVLYGFVVGLVGLLFELRQDQQS
ncbi:MAG: DUF6789 family protein, partial [Anaerolineales bacterium]